MSRSDASLFRLLDPWGAGVGFFTPLFRLPSSNPPCVQTVDGTGRIEGFTPLQRESYEGVAVPERHIQSGDYPIWAFVFDGEDLLVGQGEDGRAELERRLESPFFDQRPHLAIEVAEFLDRRDLRTRFARQAFERLTEGASQSASVWRDLTILTPDLRRNLARIPQDLLSIAVKRIERVVATTAGDTITVHGVDQDVHPAVFGRVLEQVQATYNDLKVLYRDVWTDAPKMTFVKPRVALQPRLLDAAIEIRDPAFGWLVREFSERAPGAFDVLAIENDGSSRADELMAHTIFSLAALDAPLRRPAGQHLALRPAGPLLSRERLAVSELPPGSIVVDLPRAMHARYGSGGAFNSVRNAVFAALCVNAQFGVGRGSEPFFHLHTSGVGPDPLLDSCCQLWGRLARMKLIGASGFHFIGAADIGRASELRPVEMMFSAMKTVLLEWGPPRRRRGACAVLAAEPTLSERDQRSLTQEVVESVIAHKGWHIPNPRDRRGPDRSLLVEGERGIFEIATIPVMDLYAAKDGRLQSLHQDAAPHLAKRIMVTEDAGTTEILAHLAMGQELLVSLRDLALSNPALPPIEAMLAGQLRRFTGALPSRLKSRYLAVHIAAALRTGRVEVSDPKTLEAIVTSDAAGDEFDIICRSVAYEDVHTIGAFQIRPHRDSTAPPMFELKLIYGPDGMKLVESEHTRPFFAA